MTYIKLDTLVTAATAILARHKSSQKIGDENEERAERTVVYYIMDGLYKLLFTYLTHVIITHS